MISDTQYGRLFSRPGAQTFSITGEGPKCQSFVLKRVIALFSEQRKTSGNYVMNIDQFPEPTLLKLRTSKAGTISRFIRERCLDSGGNYVLNYNTTVTAM